VVRWTILWPAIRPEISSEGWGSNLTQVYNVAVIRVNTYEVGSILMQLEIDIEQTVEHYLGYEIDPNYDWVAAKQRVEEVLRRYGSELPAPNEVTVYEKRVRGLEE